MAWSVQPFNVVSNATFVHSNLAGAKAVQQQVQQVW
eukprot:CAMPEP_0174367868 /NCGR_PEP_ID=MMETSP0811_2-20130205/86965_1 /TAXON_ID=73025 ORGANISM="Eutreptiella gymnastica-like, Strain CCMP1594" /NCGR_SAMPLE_ID=MMETSP0811_2 /ASSEMBLY_ACC=CAM_ASM_000667 /LENGTH=35 /DNA_ID= /DNA_START= /DNA_END= /DNA_ORIENTATION=